ncbi:MAG: glycosyltransferase family 4 protein [Ignavibacteriaceae bacterium]
MKVTFVNYYYDKDIPIDNYLDKYPTIHGWSRALSELGLKVSVYHRFHQDISFNKDGVNYFLIKDKKCFRLKWYQNPTFFHSKISEANHDIIHINSFIYSYQAGILKKKNPTAKIVIQHHAEKPGHRVKRFLLRNFSSSIDGFIFSSQEIYDEWLKVGAIINGKKFAEIMEGSSNFTFRERNEIRIKTGLSGNPVLLWVGRLNENKDPLTVLSGFSKLLLDFPDARLYMIYSKDQLKQQVSSFIEKNALLKKSVRLLGFIDYKDIDQYYNSADYFVMGSLYEGSGYSLVEAMSCGVVPIVTDIPSFRMMTNKGQIGALWKCGDAKSFYNKAKEIIQKPLEVESKKSLNFFYDNLSSPAIGEKAKLFYESLI